jgi:integrase
MWGYVLDLPRGADGRRQQWRRSGYLTRKDAEAALADTLARLRDGQDVTAAITVGAWLDEWLAGKRRLRENTARSYRGHVDLYLRPHLGHVRLDQLRVTHVSRMFDVILTGNSGRDRPVGPVTLHRIRATLRAALNGAIRRRLINTNVAALVELPEATRPTVRVWSPGHAGRFLDRIGDDRLAPLYHLVIVSGLRRGEVCGLRWEDVDLDTGTLRVSQQLVSVAGKVQAGEPKTAHGARVVALDPGTVSVLRDHRRRQLEDRLRWGDAWTDSGLVFTRADGSRLDPSYVTRHFGRLVRAADLPVIRLHDLRHTSASIGLAAGESLKEISDRLGHSSITITANTYAHVSPALARESAGRRAALIPRGNVTTLPDRTVTTL